jgi:cation diffusion facilitator CzcD-associated flavoprotein CzcO
MKRVAIIGAGAAGLCAARHAADSEKVKEIVVFEQTARLGGTWVYTEETNNDENGLPVHTSMYRDMK